MTSTGSGKRIDATSRTKHGRVSEDRTSKRSEQPVKRDEKSKKKGKKDCDSSSRRSSKSNTSQETGETFVAQNRKLNSDPRSEPRQMQQRERVLVNKTELAAASHSASVESTPQACSVYLPTQSEPLLNKAVNREMRLNLEKMSKSVSEQNLRRDIMRHPNDMLVPGRQEQDAKARQDDWNGRGLESGRFFSRASDLVLLQLAPSSPGCRSFFFLVQFAPSEYKDKSRVRQLHLSPSGMLQ